MTAVTDFSDPVIRQSNKSRRTTVLVTLSDKSITLVEIQRMLESGANGARFMLGQTTKGDKIIMLNKLEEATLQCRSKYGVSDWPSASCISLKTCVVKTGLLEKGMSLEIKEGSVITLTNDVAQYHKCNKKQIFVDNPLLTDEAHIGTTINIHEENLILKCTAIKDNNSIQCTVAKGGELTNLNLVTMRDSVRRRSSLSKVDFEMLKFAIENQIDMIIIFYCRKVETLRDIKQFIVENNYKQPFLIAGICSEEGVENIDEIAKEADAILLSREFLPYELDESHKYKFAGIQKYLGAKAHQHGLPYFISGGVFREMLMNGVLSHRELSDVSNALLDGASGFILGEYFDSDNAVETLKLLNEVCQAMEPYSRTKTGFWRVIDEVELPLNAAEACVLTCVFTADQVRAKVIIIPTVTGSTIRALHRMKPDCIVITVSTNMNVSRMLNAFRCAVPLKYTPDKTPMKWNKMVDARVQFALEYATRRSWLVYGDMYVVLHRASDQSSYCDTVRIWPMLMPKKTRIECNYGTEFDQDPDGQRHSQSHRHSESHRQSQSQGQRQSQSQDHRQSQGHRQSQIHDHRHSQIHGTKNRDSN